MSTIRTPGRTVSVGDAVRKLNPHLFAKLDPEVKSMLAAEPLKAPKRIRQSNRPLLNQLEMEWFEELKSQHPQWNIRAQSLRFRLGNSHWYKPDFTCITPAEHIPMAWEVKGPHAFRGGFENLKVSANLYPEWIWIISMWTKPP